MKRTTLLLGFSLALTVAAVYVTNRGKGGIEFSFSSIASAETPTSVTLDAGALPAYTDVKDGSSHLVTATLAASSTSSDHRKHKQKPRLPPTPKDATLIDSGGCNASVLKRTGLLRANLYLMTTKDRPNVADVVFKSWQRGGALLLACG